VAERSMCSRLCFLIGPVLLLDSDHSVGGVGTPVIVVVLDDSEMYGTSWQLSDLSPSISMRSFSIFSISILIRSILESQLHGGVGSGGITIVLQIGLGRAL